MDLILTSDNDQDRRALTNCVREKTGGFTEWYHLGQVLLRMGEFDKADQVSTVLLEQGTNDSEKADICHQFGSMKDDQGAHKVAITFYEKILEIYKEILPPNHLNLATSHNNIGDYMKEQSFFERSADIAQHSLPSKRADLHTWRNKLDRIEKIL